MLSENGDSWPALAYNHGGPQQNSFLRLESFNPVTPWGIVSPESYIRWRWNTADDPKCDAVLSILAPPGMTEPEKIGRVAHHPRQNHQQTLLASWDGGGSRHRSCVQRFE